MKLLEILLRPSHMHFGLIKYNLAALIASVGAGDFRAKIPRPVQEITEKKSQRLLCRLHLLSLTPGGGGGGGHLGIFWVGMCRSGLQLGTPF